MRQSEMLRVLVWQWGRRGAGPKVAAEFVVGFNSLSSCHAMLSLSMQAELLLQDPAPFVALPVPTYRSALGYLRRLLGAPFRRKRLLREIRALEPDVAICAMPGPLDLEMAVSLRQLGVPFLVVVHDADRHPGDGSAIQMALQRRLLAWSDGVIALSRHVADRLHEQEVIGGRPLLMATLPPFVFGPRPAPPLAHGGRMRLLCFGRLLPYKGLDLLADALAAPGLEERMVVRVVGQGPPSDDLQRLAGMPTVRVENRWIPEHEIASLIAWADAVVLPYREASQSGVAAAAIAARRWVIATRVGGLVEQFHDQSLAVLCEPDARALRRAIEALIAHPPIDASSEADPRREWREVADALASGIVSADLRRKPMIDGKAAAVQPVAWPAS